MGHVLTVLLLSLAVFLAAVALMSVGVLLAGRRIRGSCGALAALPGVEPDCGGTCGVRCARRRRS
jgi:hypothetical protein